MLSQAGESSWASLEESHKKGLRLGKAMVCISLGNVGHCVVLPLLLQKDDGHETSSSECGCPCVLIGA